MSFLDLFKAESYHLTLGAERVTVRSLDTGNYVTCRSEFVLDDDGTVGAVRVISASPNVDEAVVAGGSPNGGTGTRVNPFGHPRVVLDQFRAAETLIRHVIDAVRTRRRSSAYVVFVQLAASPEGGLSLVEERALVDSMEQATLGRVHIVPPSISVSNQDVDRVYADVRSGRLDASRTTEVIQRWEARD